VLLVGCGSTPLPYPNSYPLTKASFLSRDKSFTGMIPQGWYAPSQDSIANAYDAWLVTDELSASMGIRELNLDPLTVKRVEKEGLELLANISITYQKEGGHTAEIESPPKEFEMRGRKFCGYEMIGGYERRRVIVYQVGLRYFECTAITLLPTVTPVDVKDFYTAQQAVLYSLTF
jgi:hypothetical protein